MPGKHTFMSVYFSVGRGGITGKKEIFTALKDENIGWWMMDDGW